MTVRPSDQLPAPRLIVARQVATTITVVLTAVQVVVWLLICLFSGRLHTPWWLWSVFGGGAVIGLLWLMTRYGPGRSTPAAARRHPGADPDADPVADIRPSVVESRDDRGGWSAW